MNNDEEIDTLKSALNNSLAELHALKAKIERYEKALRFYEHVAALDGVDRSVATEALEEPK